MISVQQVFDSIVRCPNVDRCLDGDRHNPCGTIVLSQHAASMADFQLPEPWRGQIDKARILFVASNPSIGDDRYALGSSPGSQIWESQHLAFGGGSPYILDGIRKTKADCSPDKPVRYWESIRARARELLPAAIPGQDYAITEIVHCKSEHEIGVREATQTCYSLHINSVFAASAAEVIVVLGKVAREALLGAGAGLSKSPLQMDLGGKTRTVFFLPHPNERGSKKSLAAHYGSQALNEARNLVGTR